MILRDYQLETKAAIFKEWETNTSTIAVLPTGGGKTVVFASVIEAIQPKRAMVIAHREELIWQARDKIHKVTGLECGIEMADLFVNNSLFGDLPVVISTVQTQNSNNGFRKRMGRFDPKEFGVLILDECHHSTADSYRNLINYYKTNNPDIKILGVTATPDRTDEEALGKVFDTVAIDIEILDLIHWGWLVPVEQQFVSIAELDFSEMRTTAGDLNGADLAEVMESESNMQGVASASLSIIGNRRAIVFTASVKQAEMVCNIFNRHKDGMAAWVCGTTPKEERRDILARFQSGHIQVVCNCGVLTEGFDDPGVEFIIMARPTKSRSLYAQMAGRSMRPLPGLVDGLVTPEARKEAIARSAKPSCTIIDLAGNSGRHKLISCADILGGKVSEQAVARAIGRAKKDGGAVKISDILDEEEAKLQEAIRQRIRLEEARKAKLVAKARFSTTNVSPFDVYSLTPVRERGWDNDKVLSEKQKGVLLKIGVNPDNLPYGQAKQLLNETFRRWNEHLCTLKQAALLTRYGIECKDLKMTDASRLIDSLRKNNWRRLTNAKDLLQVQN